MQSFMQSVKKEWAKIVWPKAIWKQVLLVIIISLLTGILISGVDRLGQTLVNAVLSIHLPGGGLPALRIIALIAFAVLCVAIVVVVLMQEGKHGGLGALSGQQTFWGQAKGRSAEGRLVKGTYIMVFLFFILALALSMHPFA